MAHPQCTSQSIASASRLVFEGPGSRRAAVMSRWLVGHLSSPGGWHTKLGGLLQARTARFYPDCL